MITSTFHVIQEADVPNESCTIHQITKGKPPIADWHKISTKFAAEFCTVCHFLNIENKDARTDPQDKWHATSNKFAIRI